MKTWIVLLLVLLTGLQCELWLSSGGIASVWRVKQDVEAQVSRNETLMKRNMLLEAEVNELKMGQQALEEKARHDLEMVKHGETFYQIMDDPINEESTINE